MTTYLAETPERGLTFLGDEVRRGRAFPLAEVEAAFQRFQDVAAIAAATGDWGAFADQFTEDAVYVEHHFGVMRGRETIRSWIISAMQGPALEMVFPVLWHLIDNDLVFMYCPNRFPAPDGGDPFQFICGTILCYAGDGLWCYEEDIYNVAEAERVAALYQSHKTATST